MGTWRYRGALEECRRGGIVAGCRRADVEGWRDGGLELRCKSRDVEA